MDGLRALCMPFPSEKDTICAIATPPGPGGLGVVRLSGSLAREILAKVWRGGVPAVELKPRQLYLGEITGDISGSGPIDRAMAVLMPAPSTYTGEDVVEISAHGSPLLLARIVDVCVALGARPAEPGEFTKRAFLAGKLDLAQAEAVADLIAATSEQAARIAADQLAGKLSHEVTAIADELADLRAFVEASIDFPEEDIEFIENAGISKRMTVIAEKIGALAQSFHEGRLIRDGVRTAIVGRPNAGKSSIFNRLVGRDRAIVHRAPGTTRDVVEEAITIGGVAFRLRDTAGIRQAGCEVEGLGVGRSREEIVAADLVIAVFDGSVPYGPEDEEVLRTIAPAQTIPVINKTDLTPSFDRVSLTTPLGDVESIPLSAKTGVGFETLQRALVARFLCARGREGALITSSRHKAVLDESSLSLTKARRAVESGLPPECIAQHLRIAHDSLGKITGLVTDEGLLNRIFSRFCIGK